MTVIERRAYFTRPPWHWLEPSGLRNRLIVIMRVCLGVLVLLSASCTSPLPSPPSQPIGPFKTGVEEGLLWLLRHQGVDGSWSPSTNWSCASTACNVPGSDDMDVARTALALQALLAFGWTPVPEDTTTAKGSLCQRPEYKLCLNQGIWWLLRQQDGEGRIGPAGPMATLNHALATMTLCLAHFSCWELAEFTRDQKDIDLHQAANREMKALETPTRAAIRKLLSMRTPREAWGSPVTSSWCVWALRCAQITKLTDDSTWVDEVVAWYANHVDERSDLVSVASALRTVCELLGERRRTDVTRRWKRMLITNPPTPQRIDLHYAFWATEALFSYFQPGFTICIPIDAWQKSKEEALFSLQSREPGSCSRGSWTPSLPESGGGRTWATALAIRALGIYQVSRSPFDSPMEDD